MRKVAVGIPFTLGLTIDFIDQSKKQILMIESFLGGKGVSTGRPYFHDGAWRLSVGGIRDIKTVLQRMLPHLRKKGVEVAAALDYLRGISTGNEFQAILQQQVREGNREKVGKIISLLLEPDRPVLQPQVRRLALPAALRVEGVPSPASEADL